jgi:hypothetical protein
LLKISMEVVILTKPVSFAVQDGGSPEPRTVDSLSAEGLLPVQALSGGVAAAFRRRSVLRCEEEAGIQKGLSVFFSLFWVFL